MEETRSRSNYDKEAADLKLPPYSIEAEQSVLGSLMLDNARMDEVTEQLVDVDFYRSEHRHIFTMMKDLTERNSPFDPVILAESLEARNQLAMADRKSVV